MKRFLEKHLGSDFFKNHFKSLQIFLKYPQVFSDILHFHFPFTFLFLIPSPSEWRLYSRRLLSLSFNIVELYSKVLSVLDGQVYKVNNVYIANIYRKLMLLGIPTSQKERNSHILIIGHYVGIIKGIILTIFYIPTLHST